jgi:thiol-disulfide isomerase/thioredoxin
MKSKILATSILMLLTGIAGMNCKCQINTVITGIFKNAKNVEVSLTTDGFLFNKGKTVATCQVNDTGYFALKINLEHPQRLSLINNLFYVNPGDSVYFTMVGNKDNPKIINVTGRNSNVYRYTLVSDSLMRSLPFKYRSYDLKARFNQYLDSVKLNKAVRIELLNQFDKKSPLPSDFKNFTQMLIKYSYYNELLYPIVNKKISMDQLTSEYKDEIDAIALTNNGLAWEREYVFMALDFISYKKLNYLGEKFDLIKANSVGLTKELLLTNYSFSLLLNYSSDKKAEFCTAMDKIGGEIDNPELREYYYTAKNKFNKYLKPLPRDVLQTKLFDSNGRQFTFKELLNNYNARVIVLDYWASWCGPCIEGMPHLAKLSEQYDKTKVAFLFFSLDKTKSDWENGLKKAGVVGNHYLVNKHFTSALAQYLEIKSIPRYIIINKKKMIEKLEANSPIEGNRLRNDIDRLLE